MNPKGREADTRSELLPMESEYERTVAKGSLKATRFLAPGRAKKKTRRHHSGHVLTTEESNSIHEIIKVG